MNIFLSLYSKNNKSRTQRSPRYLAVRIVGHNVRITDRTDSFFTVWPHNGKAGMAIMKKIYRIFQDTEKIDKFAG